MLFVQVNLSLRLKNNTSSNYDSSVREFSSKTKPYDEFYVVLKTSNLFAE